MVYGMKSLQVKKAIVNCTEAQLKGFKISTAHRKYFGIADNYVTRSLDGTTKKLKGIRYYGVI